MYGFLQIIVGVKPWRPAYSSHTQTPEEIIFTIAIFITSSNSSILLVSALKNILEKVKANSNILKLDEKQNFQKSQKSHWQGEGKAQGKTKN